jgi:glycosyltransferase involved in cell wall biosynthesis
VQVFVETLASVLSIDYDVALLVGRRGQAAIDAPDTKIINLGGSRDVQMLWKVFSAHVRAAVRDADVIITNSTAISVGLSIVALLCRRPCIFVAHGLASRHQKSLGRVAVRALERLTVMLSRVAVFLNEADCSLFEWKGDARVVIPNGVEVPASKAGPTFFCDGLDVVAVMRHTQQKDFASLVTFARDALGASDRLTVVGDGPDFEKNAALFAATGKNVTLVRQAKDMKRIYTTHNVYILLSISEGMPLSLLEAMSLGLVPIASAISGIREVVEHEKNGLLVERNDSASTAACLDRLRDPHLRQRLSLGAIERVRNHFSKDRMASAYRALLKGVTA